MICEIKHYQQLTVDELYRVIQLRIQGFIVENKVCYQDLEDKYSIKAQEQNIEIKSKKR